MEDGRDPNPWVLRVLRSIERYTLHPTSAYQSTRERQIVIENDCTGTSLLVAERVSADVHRLASDARGWAGRSIAREEIEETNSPAPQRHAP